MEETKSDPAHNAKLFVSVNGGERQFVRSFTLCADEEDDADDADMPSGKPRETVAPVVDTSGGGQARLESIRRFGVCFSPQWRDFKQTVWAVFDDKEEAIQACLMLNNFLRSVFAVFKSSWVASSLPSEADDPPLYDLRGTVIETPSVSVATCKAEPIAESPQAACAGSELTDLADLARVMQARLAASVYGGSTTAASGAAFADTTVPAGPVA